MEDLPNQTLKQRNHITYLAPKRLKRDVSFESKSFFPDSELWLGNFSTKLVTKKVFVLR